MSESSDEEEFYEVECILDDKLDVNGERIYFIKWKNYGSEYMNTWEPESNLSCPDLLEIYLEQKARRLSTKKRRQRSLTTKKDSNSSTSNKPKAGSLSVSDTMRSFLTKANALKPSVSPPAPAPAPSASAPPASAPTISAGSFSVSPSPPPTKAERPRPTHIGFFSDSSSDNDEGLTNNKNKRQKKSFELSNSPSSKGVKMKGISAVPPKSSPGPSSFGGIKRARQQPQEQHKTPIETLIDQMSGSRTKDNTSGPTTHHSSPPYTTASRHERQKQHTAATLVKSHETHIKSPPIATITERPIDRSTERVPIWTGAITIKKMGYYGMQFFNESDPSHLQKEALSFLNSSELSANTAISFRIFKHLCKDGDFSKKMTVQPSEQHYLNWSKLSKFMRINNQVIVVLSPKRPSETILLANTTKQEIWTVEPTPLFQAVYLRNLRTDYIPKELPAPSSILMDANLHPNWKAAATVLGFTKEMADFGKDRDVTFEVIGTSELSNLLRQACRLSTTDTPAKEASAVPPSKKVMLFDRSNDLLNTTCLNEERASTDTRIFEFGYRQLGQPIYPALEVYPKYTGGYITTDARNILQDRNILDRMVDFARNNNEMSLGKCIVILHPDILRQIMRSGTGLPATNAISKILTFLTTNEIAIMENWTLTSDPSRWKNATMDWFQTLAEANLHDHQLFYFVEDLVLCDTYQASYPCVDFIPSSNLTM